MAKVIGERGGFRPVVIKDTDDTVGIVTVHDGPSLHPGRDHRLRSSAMTSNSPDTYHNNFQDADHFLAAGGSRGRQLQVLVEGTYYINRLFATVEMIPKTVIEVGNVGVVVSYTGEIGIDLSGKEYRHGELVEAATAASGGAAPARQVRLQHLRRQGDRRPDDQLHPEVDPQRDRRTPLR